MICSFTDYLWLQNVCRYDCTFKTGTSTLQNSVQAMELLGQKCMKIFFFLISPVLSLLQYLLAVSLPSFGMVILFSSSCRFEEFRLQEEETFSSLQKVFRAAGLECVFVQTLSSLVASKTT